MNRELKTCKSQRHKYDNSIYERCPECFKEWQLKNRDKALNRSRQWYAQNKERHQDLVSDWRANNKDQNDKNTKEWRAKNKVEHNVYQTQYKRDRRKNDELFKLKEQLRNRLNMAFNRKDLYKDVATLNTIGCSVEFLRDFLLESAIKNYGSYIDLPGIYHIDHIIPLDSANTAEELMALNHYSNLQLLYIEDNLKKSNK